MTQSSLIGSLRIYEVNLWFLWLTNFFISTYFTSAQHKKESLKRFMYANDIEIEKKKSIGTYCKWKFPFRLKFFTFYFTTEAIINYLNDFDFNFHALNLLQFFFSRLYISLFGAYSLNLQGFYFISFQGITANRKHLECSDFFTLLGNIFGVNNDQSVQSGIEIYGNTI